LLGDKMEKALRQALNELRSNQETVLN